METLETVKNSMSLKLNPSYILFGVAILAVVALLVFMMIAKRKGHIKKKPRHKKSYKAWLYPFQQLFVSIPLLNKQYQKVIKSLQVIYPEDPFILNNLATSYMLSALGLVTTGIILVFFTSGGNLFYILAGSCMIFVLYNEVIKLRLSSANYKLLKQFKAFLAEVRHNYYVSGKKIDDAIYLSIDNCPPEMRLHAEKIYEILISTDVDKEADKYISIAPNRFLMTFVAICTSVIKNGDVILDNKESVLLSNLSILREEVNIEKRRIETTNFLFSGMSFISIIAIFFIRPIELWSTKNIPETKATYEGSYGILVMVAIFATVMICYTLINNLKDVRGQEAKAHTLLERLSSTKYLAPVLIGHINNQYTKYLRINDDLKRVGDKISTRAFLLKRYLLCFSFMIGGIFLVLGANWQEKKQIINDFANSFESSLITDKNYRESMQETAKLYTNTKTFFNDSVTEQELIDEIVTNSEIKKPSYAQMVAQEIIKKYGLYKDVYFRWYLLVVILILGAAGYMLPELLLKIRLKNTNMVMGDEVNQFQTIVMMLMHTDGISLQIILEWMERFAFCFKDSITECLSNLPADEDEALEHLRDSESYPAFKLFVNNMLVVNEQGVVAAFDEIVSERENNTKDREKEYEQKTKKNSGRAGIICAIPIFMELIFYLIVPTLSMGMRYMQEFNSVTF